MQHPLVASLVLRDLQAGVVGQTGTVWTIAPDFGFTVARQFAAKTADPHKQGHLSAKQQDRLHELLARIKHAALPRRIGDPQVNGRQILLTYGRTACSLNLSAGGSLAALRIAARDPNAALLLELAEALQAMTGS